eukprot:Seg1515.2 transcript_id=Seg1515.2/GoldUCD/mRNA.D3Y31 product=Ryncolin-4 protein_id=Seg1515.2/GoldUCD/D3Y31
MITSLILIGFIVSWLTRNSNGHILRTPCQDYGNFSVIKPGHALAGQPLMLLEGLTVKECETACIHKQACKSINTKPLKCELVRKSTENPFDNVELTAKAEWTYRTTDYNEMNIGKLCQAKKPCPTVTTCVDTCQCPGYTCIETLPGSYTDCKDAYDKGYRVNQAYRMLLPGGISFHAPCDMKTDGGGWIVFQRRLDGTENFFRNWADYKAGFGNQNGNFWLGLDKLNMLAAPGKNAILRVDLKRVGDSKTYHAIYRTFSIGNEASFFKLMVGQYSGNAGDSLSYHTSRKFSTNDKDNDNHGSNCANRHKGAWWYHACYQSNLNGLFPTYNTLKDTMMSWITLPLADSSKYGSINFSEMKLKYQ